jgi:hypothetical protein
VKSQKLCKVIGIVAKSLGAKKPFNIKKCIKHMLSKIQKTCEKTNCNPSCTNVPNVDIKEIEAGFHKKMNIVLKRALKLEGAKSGCYNTEQIKRLNAGLKAIMKNNKTKKNKK